MDASSEKFVISGTIIREEGIFEAENLILWEDIQVVTRASKVESFPGDSLITPFPTIRVNIKTRQGLSFGFAGMVNPFIGQHRKRGPKYDKFNVDQAYDFVISKIIDRQYRELLTALADGQKISFGKFNISKAGVGIPKFLRGEKIIPCENIICVMVDHFGIINLMCLDRPVVVGKDTPSPNTKSVELGPDNNIPNIHLALHYLHSVEAMHEVSAGVFHFNKNRAVKS
jgi:hypothetical protein